MKKTFLISIVTFFFVSCGLRDNKSSDNLKSQIESLKSQIETLNEDNTSLRDTIEFLKYPAADRSKSIDRLISENDFSKAKSEIELLKKIFPLSSEAQTAEKQLKLIEDKELELEEEEKRIKALGFKALKESDNFEIGYNKISVGKFATAQTFITDVYGDYYRYFTADRGNKYLSTKISITSSDKNPMLPMFTAYSVNGDKLELIDNFIIRFARWEGYSTFLGNEHDNGNDFSKSPTIPFKIGIEISDDALKNPVVILVKYDNCLIRKSDRFSEPPVSYSYQSCNSAKTLSLEDLKENYIVVKILNKNKL